MSENISEELNLTVIGETLICFVVPYKNRAMDDFQEIYPQYKNWFSFHVENLDEFKKYYECKSRVENYVGKIKHFLCVLRAFLACFAVRRKV